MRYSLKNINCTSRQIGIFCRNYVGPGRELRKYNWAAPGLEILARADLYLTHGKILVQLNFNLFWGNKRGNEC